MGKSNTIDEQAKQNAAFQQYITEQTAELDKMTTAASQDLQSQITTYYEKGGWNDAKPLVSGTYQHLSTASEWSLDSVAKMIGTIKDSIFGGPPPDGTDKAEQSTDLAETVAKMSEMEVLIASAAFTAVEGILEAFTSGTQTTVQKQFDIKELAPGLTLFICVIENQYHRSDFVSDNTIIQNGYVFDTRFSIAQGGDVAKFNQMTSLIAQQNSQEVIAGKCNTALNNLDVTADDFDLKSTKYEAIAEKANAQVQVLQAEIDKLRGVQAQAVAAAS